MRKLGESCDCNVTIPATSAGWDGSVRNVIPTGKRREAEGRVRTAASIRDSQVKWHHRGMTFSHQPRTVSGIQATSDSLHLGNYIGALQQFVVHQESHDAFYFIANMHAITVEQDPAELRERTLRTAAQFLAAGLDPEKSTIFVQSQVPAHSRLSWVLECTTSMGEATRMTQFKDKSAKQEHVSLGLLTYPALMAADILLYNPQMVPVGEDQRQHLELTRNLAERFNHRFGQTFVVPEPQILRTTAKIYDLQNPNAKMSKSLPSPAGRIDILDEPKALTKKIKSAVTDAGTEIAFDREAKPGVSNLLTIYSSLTSRPVEDIVDEYAGKMYGHLKVDLAEIAVEALRPVRERTLELLDDRAQLQRILDAGAAKADEIAEATLRDVFDRVGFL
ncbi:tryptophanyl-tRNA synthetase [Brevibacterium sanguinis]|uniref:Tryptophan--tRNA ligase n=3 Tax=Brevibacteriaceae TaxID=85019 RepID=A0A366ICZ6_9MICO|nr:tryptophanyl-tRNA synthetase [Brevibacterium sanguinis]RBP68814.1 tryptophanyl-tRNA synthetase [Brevibacterium celere]